LKHFNHTAMLLLVFYVRRARYLKLDMYVRPIHMATCIFDSFIPNRCPIGWFV